MVPESVSWADRKRWDPKHWPRRSKQYLVSRRLLRSHSRLQKTETNRREDEITVKDTLEYHPRQYRYGEMLTCSNGCNKNICGVEQVILIILRYEIIDVILHYFGY